MKKKKYDLSIIIVNYNTKKLVEDCVDSIVKHKGSLKVEIILVDNGSIEKISDLKFDNSNLQVIENKKNLGYSKANNQGLKIAKGRCVLLLNSDTFVKKDSLQNLIAFAEKTPDAGVVGVRLLNKDNSIQESCMYFPTLTRAIRQYWLRQANTFTKYAPETEFPLEVEAVVGAAFLITPQALKKVGNLDERYFFFYEDLDYCKRVWRLGLKVYYLPTSEIVHYHGASGQKLVGQKDQWRRLIPSSKIYHGKLDYYLIFFVMWTGQKLWGN